MVWWGGHSDRSGEGVVLLIIVLVILALNDLWSHTRENGAATIAVLPLHDTTGLSRAHAFYWPEPQLVTEPDPDEGPVLITVTFTVPEANVAPFLEAMAHVRASRQRTGAARWSLYRDAADPSRFVEAYHVPSWDEHLRQHRDRLTGADQDIEAQALKLATGPPQVAHLFRAREPD